MVKPNPEDPTYEERRGNRRAVEKLERVPTTGKEAKGARAAAEGLENEVYFLGLAVLEHAQCAKRP